MGWDLGGAVAPRTLAAVVVSAEGISGNAAPAVAARWLRPVLLTNLIAQIGIVVTGGLVRLTGSGLGCPSWPECVPGSYTPVVTQAEGYHRYIEFGNRLLSFVVAAAVLGALAVVYARMRDGRLPRGLVVLAAALVLGVGAQAVIGGISVRLDLHPAVVAVHFLVSMGLIAGSTVLLIEGTRGPDDVAPPEPRPQLRWLAVAVGVVAVAVLALGTVVTGSGPHSGDADSPSRFGFDPRTVSWLHADAVWLFVGLVVALVLALSLTRDSAVALRQAVILLGVTLAQGVIGYVQYATDLPVPLVSLHMLGASLLVAATTATMHAILRRPRW